MNIEKFTSAARAVISSAQMLAAKNNHLDIDKHLLEHKATIEAKQDSDETPLHVACSSGHLEVVKYLLIKGAKIEAKQKEGMSPLQIACQNGHL